MELIKLSRLWTRQKNFLSLPSLNEEGSILPRCSGLMTGRLCSTQGRPESRPLVRRRPATIRRRRSPGAPVGPLEPLCGRDGGRASAPAVQRARRATLARLDGSRSLCRICAETLFRASTLRSYWTLLEPRAFQRFLIHSQVEWEANRCAARGDFSTSTSA